MPKDSQNICDELKSTVVCCAIIVLLIVTVDHGGFKFIAYVLTIL